MSFCFIIVILCMLREWGKYVISVVGVLVLVLMVVLEVVLCVW